MLTHRSRLSPTVTFPSVSAALLLAAFLIYYFPITARQEASLNDRALRHLAAMSDQLRNEVVTYAGVLENVTLREPRGSDRTQAFSSYLAEQVPEMTLVEPGAGPCDAHSARVTLAVAGGEYSFEFHCTNSRTTWRAHLPLDRVLTPYLRGAPDQLFDEIVVADANGTVLYQTRKTGARITQLPAKLFASTVRPGIGEERPNDPAVSLSYAASSEMSNLVALSMGGTDYRVFFVPVSLRVAGEAAAESDASTRTAATQRIVIAGLMRESRVRAESMAVPGTLLVAVVLLLLVVMAATWPLLKFRTMRATERVPRRTLQYFWLSMVATIASMCVFTFHVFYIFDTRSVDQNLSRLAAAVERNFEDEVTRALTVMDSLQSSTLFIEQTTVNPGACAEVVEKANLLRQRGLGLDAYPYFDRVFWADNTGRQYIKWDNSNQPTSQVNVSSRAYFQAALEHRFWTFSRAGPRGARFRVDPIFSMNTGEYLAVISRAVSPHTVVCEEQKGPRTLRVESMVTPLMSLINPVMPPDYGFALIDADGLVLFHSTATKNGQENLFHELDDSRALRSAVLGRTGHHFAARYIGVNHRFFSTPLLNLQRAPWSLVVFHDLSARSSQHLERVVLFGGLVFSYYVLAAMVLLAAVPTPADAPAWLWPTEKKRVAYMQLSVSLLFLAAAFYSLIFTLPLASLAIVAVLVPFVGLALVATVLKPMPVGLRVTLLLAVGLVIVGLAATRHAWMHTVLFVLAAASVLPAAGRVMQRSSWPSFERSYTAVWALSLMLGGIVSSVAFFKLAYDYHDNLSTRRQQVQTMAALAEREDRVRRRYAALDLSERLKSADFDVGQWLFIRRRLEQTLDRYDTEFLSLTQGIVLAPRPRPTSSETIDGVPPLRPDDRETDDAVHGTTIWVRDSLPVGLTWLASWVPYGTGTLTRQLSGTSVGKAAWTWDSAKNRLRMHPSVSAFGHHDDVASSPSTTALMKSLRNDPTFLSPQLISELALLERWNPFRREGEARGVSAIAQEMAWAALVFGCGALLTFLWITPTLARMFPGRYAVEPFPELEVGPRTPISEHTILLVLHHEDVAGIFRARPDVSFIDFAVVARGTTVDYTTLDKPIVAVNHFDYEQDDPDISHVKLDLLERLANIHPSKVVVLVTAIDPVFAIDGGGGLGVRQARQRAAPDRVLDRWIRVLVPFKRYRLKAVTRRDPDVDHRLLWSALTTVEQVAVYQLAHEGWANHKNIAAFDQLRRREIICDVPFRFANAAFRSFVLRTVSIDDRRAWEKQDVASLWDGVRLMFFVLAIGLVIAMLFFNQQSIPGVIVSAGAVLAGFTKLLSEARSFRSLLGFGKAEQDRA